MATAGEHFPFVAVLLLHLRPVDVGLPAVWEVGVKEMMEEAPRHDVSTVSLK